MSDPKLKKFPVFETDEQAEHFVDTEDLSEYDLSDMKPTHFEFEPRSVHANLELPENLVAAAKAKAEQRGVSYERFIREAIERAVAG
jgi:predicted DNA binding CopG/RHH family protein